MIHSPLELIEAARTGGQSDVDRLIEAIWSDTYRLARGILGDSHAAEGAAQDACAIVCRTISSLQEATAFPIWLYRILVRETMHIKRRNARQEPEIDVWRALSALSPNVRTAIVLRDFEELSSRNIAAVLKVPDGAVRLRLMIARHRLRPMLTEAFLDARRRIVVPPVPLARIRSIASARRDAPKRPRRKFVTALMMSAAVVAFVAVGACVRVSDRAKGFIRVSFSPTTGAAILATGTGTGAWNNVHVSFSPSGGSAIMAESMDSRLSPTIEQVRAAAHRANFPVILPAGLPGDGLPLKTYTMQMNTGGQRAIVLTYDLPGAWRRQRHLLQIILASPEMLASSTDAISGLPTTQPSSTAGKGDILWKIGHEYVIVPQSAATPAELEKIHRAMLAQIHS